MSESTIIPLGAVINDYQVISLIGAGGYAGIYKVKSLKNNKLYAMKTESIISEKKPLQAEIEIMKQLKEDFFPKLRDNGTNKKYNINYLVMDIYGASIDTIQLYNRKHLDVNTIYNVCFQMLLIIQAFHSYGLVHRDIKPSNFLISSENIVTLIDFGLSRKISHGFNNAQSSRYTDSVGTYFYRAPEIILGDSNYSTEIDIWSLGCTLYEMITRENLFSKCNTDADIANQIIQIFGLPNEKEMKNLSTLPNKDLFLNCKKRSTLTPDEFFEDKIPEEFKPMKNLLLQMLQIDPKKRITADDALNNVVLSDAVPPENLPPLTLSESLQKGISKSMTRSSSLQVELKKKQKMELKYEQLRLAKILPLNIV